MSEHYTATGPKNPDRNYTEEVILARDEKTGEVTKSIKVGGEPVELSEDEHKTAGRYLNLRKVSDVEQEKQKAEERKPAQQPGADVAGPVLTPDATSRSTVGR